MQLTEHWEDGALWRRRTSPMAPTRRLGAVHRRNDLKQTYVRGTSGNASATMVNIEAMASGSTRSRLVSRFHDSRRVSTAGDKDQKQLWILNADGLNPHKVTI